MVASRSASVNILRTPTVLLIGSVSPTIYTKINGYGRFGIKVRSASHSETFP